MYDAIIFDKDGVLVQHSGRGIFDEAAQAAFADVGVTEPTAEHVATISQVPTEAVQAEFASIAEEYDLDPADLLVRRDERAVEYQARAAENGAKEPYDDVDIVEDLGVPLGVVSNNQQGTVDAVLSTHNLARHFETLYGRAHGLDGLHRRKPDPHYLERAIADLGAENPLYVGDSGTDLLAADRAGVDSAFLRRSHRENASLPTTPQFDVPNLVALNERLNP